MNSATKGFSPERAVYEVGEKAMLRYFETGDGEKIQRLVIDAGSLCPEIATTGVEALSGATRIALRLLRALEGQGFKFAGALPSENEVIYAAQSRNGAMVGHYLQRCIDLAAALRRHGRLEVRPVDSGAAYVARFVVAGAK